MPWGGPSPTEPKRPSRMRGSCQALRDNGRRCLARKGLKGYDVYLALDEPVWPARVRVYLCKGHGK